MANNASNSASRNGCFAVGRPTRGRAPHHPNGPTHTAGFDTRRRRIPPWGEHPDRPQPSRSIQKLGGDREYAMASMGKIFKRCGCRNSRRQRLEQHCPRLGQGETVDLGRPEAR
jgi:hypothetical protein